MHYSLSGKRVWVAGHKGLVGGAICRRLLNEDCALITAGREVVDLLNQKSVMDWTQANRPEVIVLAAAKVGGIRANSVYPADFIYENLMIQNNVIKAAFELNVERLLFLGSSCIYPKHARQPILESSLLTGPLEPTNEWYAIAKIAGIKLVQAFRMQYNFDWISAMPTNLYGPGDNYDLENSHVLPAFIRKLHEAKVRNDPEIVLWGTGSPLREFLHCDDLADALVFLLKNYSSIDHINVGSGVEVTIKGLAEIIAEVVGYSGRIKWDTTNPDGPPRKLMDSGRLKSLGWNNARSLKDGILSTYSEWVASIGR